VARYTMAQYEALRDAIATGAQSVSHDGESVNFLPIEERRALLGEMEKELGIRSTVRRRAHVVGFGNTSGSRYRGGC